MTVLEQWLVRTVLLAMMFAPLSLAQTTLESAANVILIIGDGMDDQQVTIARNYLAGARGRIGLDRMPLRSTVQVLTIHEDEPTRPRYVADSANTATAIATGVVTSHGRVSTSAGSDRDLVTIIEYAEKAGLKTGIVTTSSITDATPAAFVAHVSQRGCENPDMMVDALAYERVRVDCRQDTRAMGGAGSVSEQIAASDVDVVLGGGSDHFVISAEGSDRTVLQLAGDNGFYTISEARELAAVPTHKKLLGLFSGNTMPVRLMGEHGRVAEKPQRSLLNGLYHYLGSVALPAPIPCVDNPEFTAMPSLREMTEVALDHLATDNDRGLFLLVESASIDKRAHERDICGQIGEMVQLLEALESAQTFAEANPETLILVTADHGHAAQLVPDETGYAAYGLPVSTPGYLGRVVTVDGSTMAVNYATSDFVAEEHTGVNVPLFANSVGIGKVPAMVAQPEIFDIIMAHLGLDPEDSTPVSAGID